MVDVNGDIYESMINVTIDILDVMGILWDIYDQQYDFWFCLKMW